MTLLIVILLTATGMLEPQVYRVESEAVCRSLLPKAEEMARQHARHGYVAVCVRVEKDGV